MAVKERDKRSRKPKEGRPSEQERIDKWREERFAELLPKRLSKKAKKLVSSDASPHDLKKLLDRECDPETAIKILL
jgi:hypothetical protein